MAVQTQSQEALTQHLGIQQRVEEARRMDQARLQILESRVATLVDEEEPEVYELSVAQVDSYEIRFANKCWSIFMLPTSSTSSKFF